jgi:hypothetical protein
VRRLLPILLLVSCGCANAAPARTCGTAWDFVPDAPGRVTVAVSRGVMAGYYRLTKAESAAFDQSLQKILDVVLTQPHLRPPRGIDLAGWIRQWKSSACGERDERKPCLGVPVAGEGPLHYSYFFDIKGKPQTVSEGWMEATWSVNDIASVHSGGAGAEIADLGFTLQLARHGDVDGVPVFKNPATQKAVIVLARSGRPPWTRPVSQQEVLEAAILRLEADVQREAALQGEQPQTLTPAADQQRTWQREAAARQLEMRKLIEETRRSNPTLADTLRRNFEQLEADMAAAMRKEVDIEQQKSARAAGRPAPPKALTVADRLARHRERLAAMSPAERQAQAFFVSAEDPLDPPLAPAGREAQGYALVRPNPDYFDPKLPRTALQVITLSFGMHHLQPIKPDECGGINPGDVALWQTIHQTPWQRVRSLLAP